MGIDQSGFATAVAQLLAGTPPRQALAQFDMKYGQFGGPEHSALGQALIAYRRLARNPRVAAHPDAVPGLGRPGVPVRSDPHPPRRCAVPMATIARGAPSRSSPVDPTAGRVPGVGVARGIEAATIRPKRPRVRIVAGARKSRMLNGCKG